MRRFRLCSLTAAGALAVGTLLLSAPAATATPFGDGCTATHGVDSQNTIAWTEVCTWQVAGGPRTITVAMPGPRPPLPTMAPLPGGPPSRAAN
jgi:hypothetical protein